MRHAEFFGRGRSKWYAVARFSCIIARIPIASPVPIRNRFGEMDRSALGDTLEM
jgi:hypothetical protein